jgi:serine protease Do
MNMAKKIFSVFVVICLPLIVAFWSGYTVGNRHSQQPENGQTDESYIRQASYPASARDSLAEQLLSQRHNAITRAVAAASPAVVSINVTEVREYQWQSPFSQFFGNDPFFRQFFGDRTYRQEIKSLGSGFVISPDGYIVTNDHVAGNGKEITVTTTAKEKFKAVLVGTDPVSDIALLKIEGKNFPALRLGNSDDVIIGEWAIALGNPFGLFEISDKPTVTVGVVSATGMNLSVEGGRSYRGMIQTDAAINSGNSGGPLINALGEVVGVNAVIYTPNQGVSGVGGTAGVGFAIPINRVKSVIAELKKSGKVERDFWTGLEINAVDSRVARYFGLDKPEGVIVSDVKRSSPAETGGFKVGDIVVEVNGEHIVNEETITEIVSEAKAGDVLRMKVLREKKYINLELKLEKRGS